MIFRILQFLTLFLNSSGIENPARIYRGRTCQETSHPYFVSVRSIETGNLVCGGTLLSPEWVLTAAHCFRQEKHFFVVAGYSDLNTIQKTRIRQHIQHPNFTKHDFRNDIALIQLLRPFKKSPYVDFVKLPMKKFDDPIHELCQRGTIIGLGSLSPDLDYFPFSLQCAEVKVYPKPICELIYRKSLPGTMCTKNDVNYPSDSCQGDSGGPLLCNGVQLGIVSWGIVCGEPTQPGIYTRVDQYLDFINETLQNRGNSSLYEPRIKTVDNSNVNFSLCLYHLYAIVVMLILK